jgi:hypothetical protein
MSGAPFTCGATNGATRQYRHSGNTGFDFFWKQRWIRITRQLIPHKETRPNSMVVKVLICLSGNKEL